MEKLLDSLSLLTSLNNVQKHAQLLTSSFDNSEISSIEFQRLQLIDLAVSDCVGSLLESWRSNGLISSDVSKKLDLIVKL